MGEPATHREVLRAAIGYAEASHFSALGLDFSPIKGPEGNIEFLLFVRHADFGPGLPEDAVDRVVEAAHAALDKAPSGH